MTRAKNVATVGILAAGCMLATVGCIRTHAPTTAPATTMKALADGMDNDFYARMRDLDERINGLAVQSELLATAAQHSGVGSSEAGYRQAAGQSFGDLSQILFLLAAASPDGELSQQLSILESSKSQLMVEGLASKPAVDAGLRAAYKALLNVCSLSFGTIQTLRDTLETLHHKIDELDGMYGPLHRVLVAQALGLATQATRQMSAEITQRVGAMPTGIAPATMPGTAIPAPETAAPATMP